MEMLDYDYVYTKYDNDSMELDGSISAIMTQNQTIANDKI